MRNAPALYWTFLVVLLACPIVAPAQPTSEDKLPSKSGLQIENGINRGTDYTDSLGTKYNLRYIPVIITNDTTIPIQIQIAFSNEYEYPFANGNEKFKVIPMPKEWGLNGVEITDSMFDELMTYIDKPLLEVTLEPGNKSVFAIGTQYPRPPKFGGVVPNELFVHSKIGSFPTCDWLMKENPISDSKIPLGLKLISGDSCTIIPCGQISYPKP